MLAMSNTLMRAATIAAVYTYKNLYLPAIEAKITIPALLSDSNTPTTTTAAEIMFASKYKLFNMLEVGFGSLKASLVEADIAAPDVILGIDAGMARLVSHPWFADCIVLRTVKASVVDEAAMTMVAEQNVVAVLDVAIVEERIVSGNDVVLDTKETAVEAAGELVTGTEVALEFASVQTPDSSAASCLDCFEQIAPHETFYVYRSPHACTVPSRLRNDISATFQEELEPEEEPKFDLTFCRIPEVKNRCKTPSPLSSDISDWVLQVEEDCHSEGVVLEVVMEEEEEEEAEEVGDVAPVTLARRHSFSGLSVDKPPRERRLSQSE